MTENQALIDCEVVPAGTEVRVSPDVPVAFTFAFACYGLRIGIALEDASWSETIVACLPPGWTEIQQTNLDRTYRIELQVDNLPHGLPSGVRLMAGETFAAWAPRVDLIMDSLESQLQMYLAEFASPFLFVHAGVVSWQGKLILLPGSSFAGKSTLVTALVDAGATYYSDEYAVLDHNGRVIPYPRRISLREGPLGPARRVEVAEVS